jgi:sensitive to high expression protein 9
MLRASLARASVRRQFSTSSSIPNATHPRSPYDSPTRSENQVPSFSGPQSLEATSGGTHPASNPSPTSDTLNAEDQKRTYDLELVKRRLREWSGQAAINVRNRADDFTSKAKTTFSQLGLHLNKVTGYEAIEALKRDVVDQGVYVHLLQVFILLSLTTLFTFQEAKIHVARQAARQAKTAYEQAVIERSNSQREVNDLLQRKSIWTDGDVSRFTTLVRQDHLYEQEEARAKAAVDETEDAVEREFSQLMRTILARYHEEQVWSDKIRSASTYGSLAALGLNMLVFVMAIVVVEPWKRRRLAQTFEKKIEELSMEDAARLDASMREISRQLADQERILVQVIQDLSGKVSSASAEEANAETTTTTTGNVPPEPVEVTVISDDWKLAAVATGAFAAGVLGSLWLGH